MFHCVRDRADDAGVMCHVSTDVCHCVLCQQIYNTVSCVNRCMSLCHVSADV